MARRPDQSGASTPSRDPALARSGAVAARRRRRVTGMLACRLTRAVVIRRGNRCRAGNPDAFGASRTTPRAPRPRSAVGAVAVILFAAGGRLVVVASRHPDRPADYSPPSSSTGSCITRVGTRRRRSAARDARLAAVHRGAAGLRRSAVPWPRRGHAAARDRHRCTPRPGCSAASSRRCGCSTTCTTPRTSCTGTTRSCTLVYTSHFLATPIARRRAVAAGPDAWLRFIAPGRRAVARRAGHLRRSSPRRRRGYAAREDGLRAGRPAVGARLDWLHLGNVNTTAGRRPERRARTRSRRCRRCTPLSPPSWRSSSRPGSPARGDICSCSTPWRWAYTLVYCGEHYVLDLIAGVVYALAVHVAARTAWERADRELDGSARGRPSASVDAAPTLTIPQSATAWSNAAVSRPARSPAVLRDVSRL